MTSWQKQARFGVLVFGVAVAVVVYLGLGERVTPAAPKSVVREDPTAIAETKAGLIERLQGAERKFEVTFEKSLTYSDNTIRNFGVRIKPQAHDGRQFIVNAKEGHSGQSQRVLQLAGDVTVTASDGFQMATEAGTFNQDDGIARAPAAVKFGRGRMSGSGRDASYDTNQDVLVIASEPHVVTTEDDGGMLLEFTAAAATLDRAQHLLTLDGMVHIIRGEQTFDCDRAVAFLNDANDIVTRIEMRGNSRVSGGSTSVAGMSASDIDLDYTDDGATLETTALQGGASVTMSGKDGAPGRQMSGERLELTLDPEGYLTKTVGFGAPGSARVALALPADGDVPARTIKARHLDATGLPGRGLTAARFTDEVEFREQAPFADKTDRVVTAGSLQTAMDGDRVNEAFFAGGTRFEERGLVATAPSVKYLPDRNRLELRNVDAKGGPRIEDERMRTEAREIDVTLSPRRVQARLGVRTTLQPPAKEQPGGKPATGSRLPGVFNQDQPATVTAQDLDYSGESGRAVYTGSTSRATLGQGPDNTISAGRLELDQENGDLVAVGNAGTRLTLASGESIGVAHEIRLDNAKRTIRYTTPPAEPAPARSGAAPPAVPAPAAAPGKVPEGPRGTVATTPAAPLVRPAPARLNGPDGLIRGETIVVTLAADENRIAQVDVSKTVSVEFDKARTRTATADRLIYDAAQERYQLTGTTATPVRLVERRPPDCRENTGHSLTYHKPTDNMVMVGEGGTRASASWKSCAAGPAR
jgi:lipopolysaccharide export system protein LptA